MLIRTSNVFDLEISVRFNYDSTDNASLFIDAI